MKKRLVFGSLWLKSQSDFEPWGGDEEGKEACKGQLAAAAQDM